VRRPRVPADLLVPGSRFVASRQLAAFARRTFIDEGAPLVNPEHEHLRQATIGYLWTNVEYRRGEYPIAGTCERFRPDGNAWQRARQALQMATWFGGAPDFVITLNAPYLAGLSDAGFCAVVEHELLHAGQAVDDYGSPRFNPRTGAPIWTVRSHDFEEFSSIWRRYGPRHGAGASLEFARLATIAPELTDDDLRAVSGTCGRAVG
jgi:Putative phage metallopeptidase